MIRAAGILFHTSEKKVLFLKRGAGGDYPGQWCFPGGKQEDGETLEECAERETKEEIGFLPEGTSRYWTRQIKPRLAIEPNDTVAAMPEALTPQGLTASSSQLPGAAKPGEEVDYTTYIQQVDEEFPVTIDGEHVGWAWAPIDQPPEPLHPGCRIALDRFGMNELGVARAIAAGELTSPQQYENMWLFAIRITGTGVAYRRAWDEFVWRDPSIYMNEEFLDRCNGLAVILEHPPTAVLDTKEFASRIIGTVFVPYLKPEANEVWAVVKIYDEPVANLMRDEQLSTSPSVVFRAAEVNTKLKMEDGSALLIEGNPSLLDHIAVCGIDDEGNAIPGVWDKGGDPIGVKVDELAYADEQDIPLPENIWKEPAVRIALDSVLTKVRASHVARRCARTR